MLICLAECWDVQILLNYYIGNFCQYNHRIIKLIINIVKKISFGFLSFDQGCLDDGYDVRVGRKMISGQDASFLSRQLDIVSEGGLVEVSNFKPSLINTGIQTCPIKIQFATIIIDNKYINT